MRRLTLAACANAALLVTCTAAMLGAQPRAAASSTDDALRRIRILGMDSSHVERLAQKLTDSIGPRLTGTPGMRAANEWAVATYRGWGIDARNEQYGTWRGWRRGVTHIDLVQPRVRSLEGMMLAWSPGTRGPVEAPVIAFPPMANQREFEAWLPEVRGKFVLISRAEASCRPDDNLESHATPETLAALRAARTDAIAEWTARLEATGLTARELPQRLEQAGAAGIVTNLWSGGWGVDRIFGARTSSVPTIDVACEDYGLLFRLADRRQGPVLRVEADAEMLGEVPVFNTIARIPGIGLPDEYIVLSAHFDSWDGASGATDNATGTVTMMEAMRILQAVHPRPRRTIIAGHWSGEEQGLNGSRAFAEDNPEVVAGLQALFNQDNGTGRVVSITMQGLANAEPQFRRWLSRVPDEITRHIEVTAPGSPATGGSDHAAFVCHGAPAFSLSSLGWDYRTYTWHTNRDTFDKIILDEVRSNATLTAMLAYLASEDPQRMDRTRAGARSAPPCRRPARSYEESTR